MSDKTRVQVLASDIKEGDMFKPSELVSYVRCNSAVHMVQDRTCILWYEKGEKAMFKDGEKVWRENSRGQVLDHGYVKLIEHWGSDERIVETARMSTSGGFRGWGPKCKHCGVTKEEMAIDCPALIRTGSAGTHEFVKGDERLLRYLYEHKHSTPFEFAGLALEIKAPIFVFRQWHRHRTQAYNEMSARYTPIPNEHYTPSVERLMVRGGKNKQAGGTGATLSRDRAELFRAQLEQNYLDANRVYESALADGVPKELARLSMPVARYSRMRASANLRNWLGFLTLRMDSHAQWEIQEYARAVGALVQEHYPRTWALFVESHKR